MRVVILGAGIAGLGVAHALRRDAARTGAPVDATVLEAGDRAGGRIRTTREDGWLIEWAANAIQGAEGPSWRIAEEAGLAEERVIARADAARRYICRGGKLHLVPLSPGALARFGAISPAARLRVVLEPFFARRVSRDETVYEYAARHIGEEAARVLVGAAVRGIFAGDARKLSVDAAFPVMREMERDHRSLVFAMIARVIAARKAQRSGDRRAGAESGAASPKGATGPSGPTASPASGPGRRALWTLRGGLESYIDALARPLGDALRYRSPALAIERRAPSGYSVALASGARVEADAVVLATPPRATAALLRGLDAEAARGIGAIAPAGLNVVAMGFRADAFRAPPDGYGFLVSPGEDLDVLGILFESNLFDGRAPEGHVLVRAMVGGAERPELVTKSDSELVGLSMKALDRTVGVKCGPERTWIVRQEDAIPQYAVGHRTALAEIERRLASFPGLHLAGNGYRGVSLASLLEDGERVAAKVLEGARAA
jgi:oxygen-dependent protoporphyrinogen oxidase